MKQFFEWVPLVLALVALLFGIYVSNRLRVRHLDAGPKAKRHRERRRDQFRWLLLICFMADGVAGIACALGAVPVSTHVTWAIIALVLALIGTFLLRESDERAATKPA